MQHSGAVPGIGGLFWSNKLCSSAQIHPPCCIPLRRITGIFWEMRILYESVMTDLTHLTHRSWAKEELWWNKIVFSSVWQTICNFASNLQLGAFISTQQVCEYVRLHAQTFISISVVFKVHLCVHALWLKVCWNPWRRVHVCLFCVSTIAKCTGYGRCPWGPSALFSSVCRCSLWQHLSELSFFNSVCPLTTGMHLTWKYKNTTINWNTFIIGSFLFCVNWNTSITYFFYFVYLLYGYQIINKIIVIYIKSCQI